VDNRVKSFQRLGHWAGSQWQGGAALPDPSVGWVLWRPTGGHTGENPAFQAIRRWTANSAGIMEVAGKLLHGSPNGDGVHGQIVSSRSGRVGEWTIQNGAVDTPVARIEVMPGDTLDWVVDCRANVNSDSFEWVVSLTQKDTTGATIGAWQSDRDFIGPAPTSLADQIVRAWQLALGRSPTDAELEIAMRFLAGQARELQAIEPNLSPTDLELRMLTNVCQMLMCSNEFLYVD
jgi:hypothetical protein